MMTANGKFKFPALLDELVRVDAAIVGASTAPTSMALRRFHAGQRV
jgi:hypothetical protein